MISTLKIQYLKTPFFIFNLRHKALNTSQNIKLNRYKTHTSIQQQMVTSKSLEEIKFENTFTQELPGDPEIKNTIRQVHDALYSFVEATPTDTDPYLISYSENVCKILELGPDECKRPEFSLIMTGQTPFPNIQSYAQCYGGHQFGAWAGQLGDGRVINFGEIVTSKNERYEIQLKGVGKTPYSRFADGRAVLRSSLREYVASEALHHLGIPTTRALCLIGTGDEVQRDMFYNGNAGFEKGAVVCRVAPTFVRFGTFQLPVSRGKEQYYLCKNTADWVIKYHYPQIKETSKNKYLELIREISEKTAILVAKWQSVGFVHGVLNTDNMSIMGLTIDYGPYGFLDIFDPGYSPNITDIDNGLRYAYKNQPDICQWNLVRLAEVFVRIDLIKEEEAIEALSIYQDVLISEYNGIMAKKLGLNEYNKEISVSLLRNMFEDKLDFTNTFRCLSAIDFDNNEDINEIPKALNQVLGDDVTDERKDAWISWLHSYRDVLISQNINYNERAIIQNKTNPKYIARQHYLHEAISAATNGDYSELENLMEVLRNPYTEQEGCERYTGLPSQEEMRPGISILSCSS